jgi:hypothetical protein
MSSLTIALSGCLFSLSIAYLTLFFYFTKIRRMYESQFIDLIVLKQILDEIENEKIQSDESVHKENFIKFISDSRDWAFDYIDNVQTTIDGIIQKTDKTVQYHKDFKSLEIEPYATHMAVLADAVEELKTLLPAKEKE